MQRVRGHETRIESSESGYKAGECPPWAPPPHPPPSEPHPNPPPTLPNHAHPPFQPPASRRPAFIRGNGADSPHRDSARAARNPPAPTLAAAVRLGHHRDKTRSPPRDSEHPKPTGPVGSTRGPRPAPQTDPRSGSGGDFELEDHVAQARPVPDHLGVLCAAADTRPSYCERMLVACAAHGLTAQSAGLGLRLEERN